MRLPYSSFTHLCHPKLIIAIRFCMGYQNMPSKGYVCKTWLPCRHAIVKVQQHNADAEEIALAACEVSHNIQGSAAYLQGTARHGTKLLENSAAKLHAFSLTEIRDWKLLIMPKARRKLECHTFAYAAPKLWNELPMNIRTTTSLVSFRSSLKTNLFELAYP